MAFTKEFKQEFYRWNHYRCAFQVHQRSRKSDTPPASSLSPALLLIHPIGVGLSQQFWYPFIQQWLEPEQPSQPMPPLAPVPDCPLYSLDLLGCGESDMPQQAYRPEDWAEQIAYFIEQIVQRPVVLVVQGALLPVAVKLMGLPAAQQIQGLVLSGPPAWSLMSTPVPQWQTQLSWQLFASPLGSAFYRYARREAFLSSFSERQLFGRAEDITANWLEMLHAGSRNMNSRYAVFSFLAGFWRQDYTAAIAQIQQPVLVVMGQTASTIDRTAAKQLNRELAQELAQGNAARAGTGEPDEQAAGQKRLQAYLDRFPRAQGVTIPGRNVLPYESAGHFVRAIAPFIADLDTQAS